MFADLGFKKKNPVSTDKYNQAGSKKQKYLARMGEVDVFRVFVVPVTHNALKLSGKTVLILCLTGSGY